jgi:hypothetical protein
LQVRRREFIAGIGSALAWPWAVQGQQALPVVGYLSSGDDPPPYIAAFHQGLSDTGFVVNRNVVIEYRRSADGGKLAALAAETIARRIKVIYSVSAMATAHAIKASAGTIPIGIMTINPPTITPPMFDNPRNGPIYPTYVPKTDEDGNDLAGIRLPDVTVPLATYTGWSLRGGAHANDGCEGAGQMVAFPKTKADRLASGDPRLSIEERYPSFSVYAGMVKSAVEDMVTKRLMLQEDAQPAIDRLLRAGQAAGVIRVDASSK